MANTHSLRVQSSTATTGGKGISAPSSTDYNILTSNERTFEMSVKVNSLLGTSGLIERWDGGDKNLLFRINADGTVQVWGGSGNSTLNSAQSTTAINDSAWHHVAASWNGSVLKIYVDGTLEATSASMTPAASSALFGLAGAPVDGGSGSNADIWIDDIRVWDVERTQTQINDNKEVELVGTETNLLHLWKLDNDYTDEVSGGVTLTAITSPVFSTDVPYTGSTPDVTVSMGTQVIASVAIAMTVLLPDVSIAMGTQSIASSVPAITVSAAGGGISGHATIFAKLAAFWKLEEATGSRVDEVNAYDLTPTNSPTNAAAVFGNGVSLDTTVVSNAGNWVGHADNAIFDIDASVTDRSFGAIINTVTTTSAPAIAGKWDSGSAQRNWLFRVESDGTIAVYAGSGGSTGVSVKGTVDVADGADHLVGFTFTASDNKWRLYVDGVLDGTSAAASPQPSTAGFAIGAADNSGSSGSSDQFTGVIDHAFWADGVLDGTEWSDLWNSGSFLDWDSGAGGNVTVAPTTQVIVSSIVSPTVDTSSPNITVSPSTQVVAISGISPQVETESIASFGVAEIAISAISPSVLASGGVTINAGTQVIAASAISPTVSVPAGVNVVVTIATQTIIISSIELDQAGSVWGFIGFGDATDDWTEVSRTI